MSFDSGLQLVPDDAAFRGRATPGVDSNGRCLARVTFARRAVQRVRRKKPFHALDVSCRRAGALVHVTATNPFCAWRHSNLISAAIVADRCARCVRAVEEIVARLLRIVPAWIADTIMDRVVPVKVMIGVYAVPAAIVRLEGVVGPANTSVCAGNHDSLPFKPERPDIRRVCVNDARLDCRWSAGR